MSGSFGPTSGLRPVAPGRELPFVPFPPVHCARWGDHLCVVAIEGLVQKSVLVLLDRDGQPQSPGLTLPFLVTGMAATGDQLVLTASRTDGSSLVAGLSPDDAALRWVSDVPVPDDVTKVAEPAVVDSHLEAVWQAGFDRSTLWSADVGEAGTGSARPLAFADVTGDSALAAAEGQVAVVRLHGEHQQLDVSWCRGATLGSTTVVARGAHPTTPSIAALPRGAAVAWSDGSGLRVSRVEPGSAGSSAELTVPLAPARLRSCDVLSGDDGRVAVVWHAERLGDPQPLTEVPGRQEPARRVDGWVALLDPDGWQLGAAVPLDPAGTLHHTGGWLGDRLLLVHGDQVPLVTAFAAGP